MRPVLRALLIQWFFLMTLLYAPTDLFSADVILFDTEEPRQGQVFSISVLGEKELEEVELSMGGEKIYLPCNGRSAHGIFGIDLAEPAGFKELVFILRGEGWRKELAKSIKIVPSHFPTQYIDGVEDSYVNPGKDELKRIEKESLMLRSLWKNSSREVFWEGDFVRPFAGFQGDNFGKRRVINGESRSPHTGVDSHARRGTPVKSINNGIIRLVGDLYFSGISIVVDHGGGLFSMYFHLEDATVEEGNSVQKGEVIGHVGDSGRATGPHLHLGIRFVNQRVDPMDLFR